MEKIKNDLQYIGIAVTIIGIFAGIRFLALEFAAVRWTLVILICMAIKEKVFIPNFITLSFIVQLPLYYIVAGFLFGYSTINGRSYLRSLGGTSNNYCRDAWHLHIYGCQYP